MSFVIFIFLFLFFPSTHTSTHLLIRFCIYLSTKKFTNPSQPQTLFLSLASLSLFLFQISSAWRPQTICFAVISLFCLGLFYVLPSYCPLFLFFLIYVVIQISFDFLFFFTPPFDTRVVYNQLLTPPKTF